MQNQIKILIVGSLNNHASGLAPFITEQARALQDAGATVDYFGVVGRGIVGYLRNLTALRRKIRDFRPDIIHAHYGLCGLLANLQRRVPVVTTYHGSDINLPKSLRFSRIAMALSAHNIFVSRRTLAIALHSPLSTLHSPLSTPSSDRVTHNVASQPIISESSEQSSNSVAHKTFSLQKPTLSSDHVINNVASQPIISDSSEPSSNSVAHNFVNVRLHKLTNYSLLPCGILLPPMPDDLPCLADISSRLEPGVKHVLFAGAFSNTVKNAPLAQQSVALLNSQLSTPSSDRVTHNVASQPIISESSEQSSNSVAHNFVNVQLHELANYSRSEVYALMYSCDALLLTSFSEGSPQVIKEAMACGCPVVSVDVGDVAERTQGLDGCYVASGREPEELAQLLRLALAHPRTLGRERIIADGLDNTQVAQNLLHIYATLIDNN